MSNESKNESKRELKTTWPPFVMKRVSEGGFILVLTFAFFVLLSLQTYQSTDPGFFRPASKSLPIIVNAGGQVGAFLADGLYWLFGYLAYVLPLGVAYLAWIILHDHRALRTVDKAMLACRSVGLWLLLVGGCGLLTLLVHHGGFVLHGSGGLLGEVMVSRFCLIFNLQGTLLLLVAILLVGITWLTGLSWVHATESLGRGTLWMLQAIYQATQAMLMACKRIARRLTPDETVFSREATSAPILIQPEPAILSVKPASAHVMSAPAIAINTSASTKIATPSLGLSVEETKPSSPAPAVLSSSEHLITPVSLMVEGLPALTLLDKGTPGKPMGGYTPDELEALSRDVEQHLMDFGIQTAVVAVHPGPVITRFELQLAAGVKASRLTALAKDLARSLSVLSVRVVEIIPGKTVVGLELPNPSRATVALAEVFSAEVYQQAHSPLTLALGVDIAGHPMVVDLAKMPHLLVAGTTGSGKSVGINAMILSLLFRATPEQVRLILVDPKMLELSVYDGIPHLLTPVVTDMKEASSALRWCVEEMERRYRLMAAMGVRHLVGFNAKVTDALARGEVLTDPLWKPTSGMSEEAPGLTTLPYIVVVIDELADMMMVVGKKVEQLIARIAQKARAAGIHLILATQRPSVDVLTGLIKSNIPTRISFQVSSKIDSRTILDQQGAEQLLGYGDMLFLAPGTGAPLRVHGAYVDDQEVHRVASDWRSRGAPQYIEDITKSRDDAMEGNGSDATEDSDPLYDEAVEFVLQTRKASTSAVQRRFKIGYNRAARLVDEMERTGLVGPLDGGFRDVLVSSTHEGS